MKLKLDARQREVWKNFPATHWLNNPEHVHQLILWTTFYRRNLHRFAIDYLGLSLYPYQIIILFLMGRSPFVVWVASRAASKSFIIGVYNSCRAILWPGSELVITAGTRGQSKKIVTEKIIGILYRRSSNLEREIIDWKDNQNEVEVNFRSRSRIFTVTCSKTARGGRSTVNIGEEAREIDKKILDEVISPFKIVRQPDYIMMPEYADHEELLEQPVDIYITSSFDDTCWVYKTAQDAIKGMLNGTGAFFMALDYSITLKHNLRTRAQLIHDKRQFDPLTWNVEYENFVLKSNEASYFNYPELKERQTIRLPWYPRKNEDVLLRKPNRHDIQKQPGEIRVVACDIAAVDRSINDNSIFSCLRLFPETLNIGGRAEREFRIQVPYLESMRGTDPKTQAIRTMQLFTDFKADYIVLDTRSFGLAVADAMGRVLYDDERNCEYRPIKVMNDDTLAARASSAAEAKIFAVQASMRLNSDIAINMKASLTSRAIDLLIDKNSGLDALAEIFPEYLKTVDPDERMWYERPYLETMMLISEMVRLTVEKKENTGIVVLRERGVETKDRYTAVSYGAYFASLLARDILRQDDEGQEFKSCVSSIDF